MAQNDVKVSALNSVSTLSTNDLSLETVVDELSATGYTSKKITEGDKAAQYLSSFTFSTLDTISKTIIGAINELYAGGGGGGGGSVVTITPALLSGTKVADFSIDGVTGSLYAPTAIDTLSGLTDISITTPTDGQALIYDATTQKWKNATISSGSSSLSGLTDVSLSSPTNGQVLKYNSSTNKWENAAESGGGGGSAECFVVEFEANENTGYYEVITTAADIVQAVEDNDPMIATLDGNVYAALGIVKSSASSYTIRFVSVTDVHADDGASNTKTITFDALELYLSESNDVWSVSCYPSRQYVELKEPYTATGTLAAGSTSLTLSVPTLSSSSKIDIYTTAWGVNPTAVTPNTSNHTIALTFEAQQSSLGVKVEVK